MSNSTVFHPANERGQVHIDWLKSNHSFSFGQYYNPEMMGFGVLRVINDDVIAPARGFGTHPHRDMEIITVPIAGQVLHRDSLGTEGTVSRGEVQMMAAGTGILHSEVNPSATEALKLFQILIIPREEGLKPGYQQMKYETSPGQVRWLVSPLGDHAGQETLRINQDAHLGIIELGHEELELATPLASQGTYFFLIEGEATVNGDHQLKARDALGHWEKLTKITGKAGSKALIFHVPAISGN